MYVAWRNYILKLYFILIILVCFSVWQVWFISTGFGLVSYDTVCTNTAVKGSPYISEEFSICNHFRTHDSTPSMCTLRHYTHTGACAPYTHCIQTVHTHARMHTRVHTRTHTHAHTRTHMCTRTHMYTHVRMHTHARTCAHTYVCTHVRTCTHTHTRANTCTHTYTCTHTRVHTCVHTHTHTHTPVTVAAMLSVSLAPSCSYWGLLVNFTLTSS